MATLPTDPNANVQALAGVLWKKTVVKSVVYKLPVLAKLFERRQMVLSGKAITWPASKATSESVSQDYGKNDPLTVAKVTTLENPYLEWKMTQTPVTYDIDEFVKTGNRGTSVENLVNYYVSKAHEATRIHFMDLLYEVNAASSDSGKPIQSLIQPLTHDSAYAHITRTIGSEINTWFQGASIDESFTDQATNYAPSIDTVRRAIDAVQKYEAERGDLLIVTGPTIHRALKAWVESKRMSTSEGSLAKYGFDSFTIDGVECVKDSYLRNSVKSNAHKVMFVLNLATWELRMHPARAMTWMPFKWQGDQENGLDQWVARIMTVGNLICYDPNKNIYLTNVA